MSSESKYFSPNEHVFMKWSEEQDQLIRIDFTDPSIKVNNDVNLDRHVFDPEEYSSDEIDRETFIRAFHRVKLLIEYKL